MDFEDVTLSETGRRETNTVCSCFCVESKKVERVQRVDWWLAGAGRWGNGAIPGQKIHTSSCKTITLWGSNARHGSYS